MDSTQIAKVLRDHAKTLDGVADEVVGAIDLTREDKAIVKDAAELVRVLARVAEGKPLERAFGAPGDWGYSTAIGKALASHA